jgi:hypothetical protein
MAAFIDGKDELIGLRLWAKATKTLTGTAVETPVLTIRCKEEFQWTHNHGLVKVQLVGASVEHTKPVAINFYANSVLVWADFNDLNTNISETQIDTAATSFSGGIFLFGLDLNKVGSDTINLNEDKYAGLLLPWNNITATIAPTSGNWAEGSVVFNFVELF